MGKRSKDMSQLWSEAAGNVDHGPLYDLPLGLKFCFPLAPGCAQFYASIPVSRCCISVQA